MCSRESDHFVRQQIKRPLLLTMISSVLLSHCRLCMRLGDQLVFVCLWILSHNCSLGTGLVHSKCSQATHRLFIQQTVLKAHDRPWRCQDPGILRLEGETDS